jgi:glucose dehydrogenase
LRGVLDYSEVRTASCTNLTSASSQICLSRLDLAGGGFPLSGQSSTKDGEWPTYAADLAGTRYRPLDQINAANFNDLEVAWRFKTDNLGPFPEYKLEGTPLMKVEAVLVLARLRTK